MLTALEDANRVLYTAALVFSMIASPILGMVWGELFCRRRKILKLKSPRVRWWNDVYGLIALSLTLDGIAIALISGLRVWDMFDYYNGRRVLPSVILAALVVSRYTLAGSQLLLLRAVWIARHTKQLPPPINEVTQPEDETDKETKDV